MRFRLLYLLAIAAILAFPTVAYANYIGIVADDGTKDATYYFGFGVPSVATVGSGIQFTGEVDYYGPGGVSVIPDSVWVLLNADHYGPSDLYDPDSGDELSGPQLYSGSEDSPVFVDGTYDVIVYGAAQAFHAKATVVITPEPSSFILLSTGAFGLFGLIRRRRIFAASHRPSLPLCKTDHK